MRSQASGARLGALDAGLAVPISTTATTSSRKSSTPVYRRVQTQREPCLASRFTNVVEAFFEFGRTRFQLHGEEIASGGRECFHQPRRFLGNQVNVEGPRRKRAQRAHQVRERRAGRARTGHPSRRCESCRRTAPSVRWTFADWAGPPTKERHRRASSCGVESDHFGMLLRKYHCRRHAVGGIRRRSPLDQGAAFIQPVGAFQNFARAAAIGRPDDTVALHHVENARRAAIAETQPALQR